MAGKGSKPRPYNPRKYAENHEKIFGKRTTQPHPMIGQVMDGRRYMGNDGWHHLNMRDGQLRDECET
jgi:hypothetical protein